MQAQLDRSRKISAQGQIQGRGQACQVFDNENIIDGTGIELGNLYSLHTLLAQSLGASNPSHRMLAWSCRGARWQDAISAVRLLVDGHVMWQSPKQVQLSFYPSQYLLRRCQEFDVSKPP